MESNDATAMPNTSRVPPVGWWGWGVVAALIVIELATFVTYARREIVWAFPGAYDQTAYLTMTYGVGRDISERGLPAAVRTHLAKPNPSGVLLPIQGAVHCVILGPNRLGALSVNFLHLAVFQWVLVATLVWLTRNWWLALVGLGLTLTLKTAFLTGGGAFDFRMDFSAWCLFGVFLCALIRSRVLLNPRGAAAVGACAAVLVLFRFITAVYIGGILTVIGGWLIAWRFACSDAETRARVARRLRGWLIATGVLVVVTWPVLWNQRKPIREYYIVGHVTSSEKDIRAGEVGLRSWTDTVLYYPRSIVSDHTGRPFWWTAGILGVIGIVGRARMQFLAGVQLSGAEACSPRVVLAVAMIAFLVPYLVLNVGAMKSPVVGDILLPPLIWIALAPLIATAGVWREGNWGGVLRVGAIATLLVGGVAQLNSAASPSLYTSMGEDGPRTMQAIDDLAEACNKKGLASPEVFLDASTHEMNGRVFQVVEFEKRGRWREYRDGTSIFAQDEEFYLRHIERCDLVVLKGVPPGAFQFPSDAVLEKMRPQLQAYCDANMIKIGEYRITGRLVTTYIRKCLRVEGTTADGWVTADGVRLAGTAADLKGCRRIELHRGIHASHIGRTPNVTAEVEFPDLARKPLAASASGDLQVVGIEWEAVDLPPETPVTIHIRFDTSFVPRELGLGTDPRSLVMHVSTNPRVVLIQYEKADAKQPKPATKE